MILLGTVHSIPLYFSSTFLIFLHDTCDFVDSRYTDNPHIRIFHGCMNYSHSLIAPLRNRLDGSVAQRFGGTAPGRSGFVLQDASGATPAPSRLHCLGILDLHRRTALSMGVQPPRISWILKWTIHISNWAFPVSHQNLISWYMLYFSRRTNHPPQKKKKRYFHS